MTQRASGLLLCRLRATLAAFALVAATASSAQVAPSSRVDDGGVAMKSARAQTTGRIIVKWRDGARSLSDAARAAKVSARTGFSFKSSARSANGIEALSIERHASHEQLEQMIARLTADPEIEFASVEYRRKAHALTNDPLLMQQWYLLSDQPAATRTNLAWDVTQGVPSVVVAVLDTGVRRDHPDLQGKLLPGYDFISHPVVANDNDGRDADESDPGDWVTKEEVDQNPNDFLDEDCLSEGETVNSSWHGTRVAGLIAAQTNNGEGVAGNAWNTQVLPVRVLGKCGGSDLDIMDAMRWAAGIAVNGMTNPTPAHIINLSLGGEGACTSAYQATVNDITARGVLIVASAGNEGQAVSAPANCNGVLGVAGLRHAGTKVGYSNLGPQVSVSAPGGNCGFATGPCLYPIVVATNSGTTTPGAHSYNTTSNVGTSFSAPMAASAAALLRAVNTSLSPAQMIQLLKATASPFPTTTSAPTCTVPTSSSAPQDSECNCTTQTCGAGMLNTGAAVNAALRPLAVLQTSGIVSSGATLSINGSSSFASQGRTIAAHHWSVSNVTGATPTIANTSQASTTLQIPGESQFTLRLTVTDDQGAQDFEELTLSTQGVAPTPAPTPTPTPTPAPEPTPAPAPGISTGGGGGGGGQLGWELIALALIGLRIRRRR